MRKTCFIFLITYYCSITSVFAIKPLRIFGDSGFIVDSTRFDSRISAMREWAKAGVEGGIPSEQSIKIVKRITPNYDLQKTITQVGKKGGVILLMPGEYIINSTIRLCSGVILRGLNKEKVLLSVKLHGFHSPSTKKPRQSALLLENVEKVGIENLTIKYTGVNFEPNDKNTADAIWERSVFHEPEKRDTTLFVEHIWINNSRNCWVQNCNILWAGSDPIRITSSKHITCRKNFIDRCYNKNDGGMGYYNLINSQYVLICNEKVKRIRHLAIQNNSKYNVIINNDLEVDINFHNGDDGYNLIENNKVKIPMWHSWKAVSRGDPNQHQPPGKKNLLFNNHFENKDGEIIYSNVGVCYQMNSNWKEKTASVYLDSLHLKSLYSIK